MFLSGWTDCHVWRKLDWLSNKLIASGLYSSLVELLKAGSENTLHAIHNLTESWSGASLFHDFILVSLYKGKDKKSICNHYYDITLLEAV